MSAPHRATPEQWADAEDVWAASGSHVYLCILELRDRLAIAEQRISELEGGNRAMSEAALKVKRDLDLRRANANSSAGLTGSASVIKPPELTDEEARALFWGQDLHEAGVDAARRIHCAGWDAAMAAANAKPTPNPSQIRSSAHAGSLIEAVSCAIDRSISPDQWLHRDAARDAIKACADWLDARGVTTKVRAARLLREELE